MYKTKHYYEDRLNALVQEYLARKNVQDFDAEFDTIYVKKGRGKRKLEVPNEELKLLSRHVLHDISTSIQCHPKVFSYRKGYSFGQLVELHAGKYYFCLKPIL